MKGFTVKRLLVSGATILVAAGIAAGGTMAASAGTPTPTPTVTVSPTPTVTPPVVNPFAGCSFTVSEVFTFDPVRHRFIARNLPAILCRTPRGVQVYDLIGNQGLRR